MPQAAGGWLLQKEPQGDIARVHAARDDQSKEETLEIMFCNGACEVKN